MAGPILAALALHALVAAAAFLVPREFVGRLLAAEAPAPPAPAEFEQEVLLAAPPEPAPPEAPPEPAPAEIPEEPAPALADALPLPLPEAAPAPPEPELPPPAPPAPPEPVAAALPVAPSEIPAPEAPPALGPQVVIGNDGFPRPDYPFSARAHRQQGTVVLAVAVVNGEIVAAAVADSSGYPLLDRAAVQCVRQRWRFPATVTASLTQPIRFSLE